jgi:hypothetical protein
MQSYTEQFESVSTINDLYKFRDYLILESEKYSSAGKDIDFDRLNKCHNANFFKDRVEKRIEYLEQCGISLDNISVHVSTTAPTN